MPNTPDKSAVVNTDAMTIRSMLETCHERQKSVSDLKL